MLSTEKSVINGALNGDGVANGKNADIGYTNAAFTAVPENLDIQNPKIVNGESTINSDSTIENASDVPERAQWNNSIEFLMSCISMSVGLGNIWRFPFTAYENGGGAFLIPYVVVLFIIGKPMYYLEMILGQFSSSGSVKVWELNPLLRGIGYGQMIAVVCVVTYYCSLIALTLHYLFASMNTELPWSSCKDSWEVPNCIDSKPSSSDNPDFNNSLTVEQAISSSELYFLRDVLKEKDDISDGIGNPDWRLTLYLLLAWAMIFLLLIRGVRSSGKASYFLALFPYVVLITLLIRASSLPGAGKGIKFFLEPKWEELYKPQVWYAATTQLFFSLSVGVGSITMFSSYNRFRHNIYRDALIVTSLDTVTSLLAGITIFAILGNLAHNLGVDDIGSVVKTGTTLAFISYPDAISKFDSVPQLFAIMFFFMLMVIGIGSGVALHNTIITIFCDSFPKVKYWKMAAVTSVGGFACGLIYVTPGGQWMLSLVDHFGGTFLIFALSIIEICAISWIYGLENFCDDAEFMLNRKVTLYWRICWAVVTPGFMIIIFIYNMIKLENPTYSGWDFPDSAIAAGWVLFVIGILQLPLWGTWLLARNKAERTFWGNITHHIKPTEKWGPKDAKTNVEWREYKREKQETRLKKANALNHTYFQRKINFILGRY